MNISLVLIVFYLIFIIALGVIATTGRFRIIKEVDYCLSDRQHSWIGIGASTFASGCSAFAFIGMAGLAYTVGISMIWYSLLATTWSWATFFVIGKRLRKSSERAGCLTVTEYIGKRFRDEDKNGILVLVATIIIIFFMIGYVASQFTGMARAFEGFVGWPFVTSMIIGAIIVTLYTFLAGFRAVVWTDTLQAAVMLIGSLALFIFALAKAGGLTDFLVMAGNIDQNLITTTGGKVGIAFATFLIAWIGSGIMGIGNPHVVVRPMAIKDWKKLREAGVFALFANMWVMYLGVFAGLGARIFVPELTTPDLAYPVLVMQLIGPFWGGLIIAGLIASSMSTGDSQLLVGSTEFVRNIYSRFINPKSVDKQRLLMTRLATIIMGIVGILFALHWQELVFWMILFAWAGLGCSFGPLLILALYWKRVTWAGALGGMLSGALTVIIWNRTPALVGFIYEGVPGFIVSLIVIIVISLLTQPPENVEDLMA